MAFVAFNATYNYVFTSAGDCDTSLRYSIDTLCIQNTQVSISPIRRLELNGIKIFNSREYLIFSLASYTPNGSRSKDM